ncbi:hypothetical protein WJX74_005760 [Apatococcus lobatus]|uniref:Translation initiation factor eIF2B subunit delta n=1 Tax=Apatococcus lobatus TaxID=904363 RepID=A0AAW1SGA6_9CHLO
MQPATKVVGFRVEGAAQSPSPGPSLLHETTTARPGTGSPNPVLIPPAFQTGPPNLLRRSAEPIGANSQFPLQRTTTTPAVMAQYVAQPTSPSAASRRSVSSPDGPLPAQQSSPRARPSTTQSLPPLVAAEAQDLRQRLATGGLGAEASGKPADARQRPGGSSRGPSDSSAASPSDSVSAAGQAASQLQPDEGPAQAAGAQLSAFASTAAQLLPGHSPTSGAAADPTQHSGKARQASEESRGVGGRSSGERERSSRRGEAASRADSSGEKEKRHGPPPAAPPGRLAAGKESSTKEARSRKGGPPAGKEEGEKKQTTRAERRAQQEEQRAAKAAEKTARDKAARGEAEPAAARSGAPSKQSSAANLQASQPPSRSTSFRAAALTEDVRKRGIATPKKEPPLPEPLSHTTEMFAHLPQFKALSIEGVLRDSETVSKVHPCILRLGFKFADGSLKGGNTRAIALISALRQLIQDYTTPEGKVMSRDLTQQLNAAITFLVDCRPISVSMGNTIKFLKLQVGKLHPSRPEEEAKADLIKQLDDYLEEKIKFAEHMLVTTAVAKVGYDEVLLTYAHSSTIYSILLHAHQVGKRIRVIIVDSRPQNEGRQLLQKLLRHGIPCTYTHLNALSYVMEEATKVFLGASAVHTNGTVLSRAGTAAVAMMAATFNKPVLICCETYKFHERVQLDSFTYNELGDPDALLTVPVRPSISALSNWHQQPCLGLLNLAYDVMPADFITLIITEFGAIPSTSVPVILREYRQQPTLNGQVSS